VPELPDLAVVAEALDAALAGRPVTAVAAPDPLVLRATPAQAGALLGQLVRGIGRRGKYLVLRLERNDIWAAPMLSGRFALATPGAARPRAAVALTLGQRIGPLRPPARWLLGAAWLPRDELPAELRYLDATRMGKLYITPAGDPANVPGVSELGPDADDPALTGDVWRALIRRHPGELKTLLRNQAFVAGLGNAYSDEILWAARLNPFRRRVSLADDEVAALHGAMQSTLSQATALLRERVPPTFERQVRDHLLVHLRGGRPCPRCGTPLSQVGRREVTSYCRSCQP
jgi:formamidopyrimidine-DNA glycosylase